MQQIDPVNLENKLQQKSPSSKDESLSKWRSKPSEKQIKLVSALWARMSQLYRHKWDTSEGRILDDQGNYSDGFLLWCRKTESLTHDEWRRGFDVLEQEIREAERSGDNLWPPSYPAFIEKCQSRINAKMYKVFPATLQLEDKTTKEKRKEQGRQECQKLLSMFE